MKIFVIIAIVAAYVYGAPTTELQHPSPVNPDILVEIKPEEKIILITDPKELAKFKRETKQPLYPTVLPRGQVHHITKRDYKPDQEELPRINTEYVSVDNLQKAEILPVIVPQVVVVKETPVISRDQEEISPVKKDLKENLPQKLEEKKEEVYQKPQGLPAIFSPSNKSIQQKRDIPVPLVPRHHHPEESPKEINEKEQHGNENNEYQINLDDHEKHQTLPLISNKNNQDEEKNEKHNENLHATKVELEKAQLIPLILKETSQDTQHKRDIPVPLVPKHHHPEESPKVSNEKEIYEDKEGLLKAQAEPAAILKKVDNNAQPQKRDTILSEVVNEYPIDKKLPQPEKNKDELQNPTIPTHNQDHSTTEGLNTPHVVPVHHYDHLKQTGFNKIQIQSNQHEEFVQNSNEMNGHGIQTHHVVPRIQSHSQGHHFHSEILQKPHAITNGLKEGNQNVHNIESQKHVTGNIMSDTNQFAGGDVNSHQVQMEDLSSTINNKPVHQALSVQEGEKEHNENKETINKNTDNHPNIHEVQIEDLSDKVYQKPVHQQTLHDRENFNTNESNENKEKVRKNADNHPNIHEVQIEDLSNKVYQKPVHHRTLNIQENLNPMKSNENKEKVKKNADNHPNIHEVQIEDLSDKVYQKPIHHEVEHKPNIFDDHSTEHSNLIRRPVPVAELFSRPHAN